MRRAGRWVDLEGTENGAGEEGEGRCENVVNLGKEEERIRARLNATTAIHLA